MGADGHHVNSYYPVYDLFTIRRFSES